MSVRPEELLAAYADDGLEPDERAAVERFVAGDPSSARELNELQTVVERLREHARAERTGTDPSWEVMAADIRRACNEVEAARARRWPALLRRGLRRLFTPRPALALGAAAMAAAALLLVLHHGDAGDDTQQTGRSGPEQLAHASSHAPDAPITDRSSSPTAVTRSAVGEPAPMDEPTLGLVPDELHAAFDTIDSEAADGELMENVEWLADDMALLTGLELDVLAEPMYEDFLEDVSEETLDELLAQAG